MYLQLLSNSKLESNTLNIHLAKSLFLMFFFFCLPLLLGISFHDGPADEQVASHGEQHHQGVHHCLGSLLSNPSHWVPNDVADHEQAIRGDSQLGDGQEVVTTTDISESVTVDREAWIPDIEIAEDEDEVQILHTELVGQDHPGKNRSSLRLSVDFNERRK